MIKVLYPHTRSNVGGSLISTMAVADKAKQFGWWMPVFVFPCEGPGPERARNDGFTTLTYGISPTSVTWWRRNKRSFRKILSFPVGFVMIARAIKVIEEHQPDIIHINDDSSALVWGIAGKLRGVPVVWHIRQERRSRLLDSIRDKFTAVRIFLSDAARDRIAKWSKKPTYVIPNGINFEAIGAHRYPESVGLASTFRFLFLGNIVGRKRPLLAVEAVKVMREMGCDVLLRIAGEGWDETILAKLEQLIASEQDDWCRYVGYCEQPYTLMRDVDGVIITSTRNGEALPRAAIEAHAHGLPVLTTDCGSVTDIVQDGFTGYVVDDDSSLELAIKGVKLITDKELCIKMGKNARAAAERKFAIDKIAFRVLYVYKSLLK